jgi:hypothetical protein
MTQNRPRGWREERSMTAVTLEQVPAEVHIEVAVDDSFSSLVDLSISLTGYTVTAVVEHNSGSTTSFTVVNTDLSAGQVTISLTKAQITAIGVGVHHWYLRYGNGTVERRAFAGDFRVVQ